MREVGKLIRCAGLFCLIPLISPYRADRDAARAALPEGAFLEVFVNTPLAACEERDPKGLYAKARRGEIRDFTGIDAPYEPPLAPDLELDASGGGTPEQLARQLLKLLQERGHLASANSSSSSSALGVARAAFCASHASSSVPSSSSSFLAAGPDSSVVVRYPCGDIEIGSIPGGSPEMKSDVLQWCNEGGKRRLSLSLLLQRGTASFFKRGWCIGALEGMRYCSYDHDTGFKRFRMGQNGALGRCGFCLATFMALNRGFQETLLIR